MQHPEHDRAPNTPFFMYTRCIQVYVCVFIQVTKKDTLSCPLLSRGQQCCAINTVLKTRDSAPWTVTQCHLLLMTIHLIDRQV